MHRLGIAVLTVAVAMLFLVGGVLLFGRRVTGEYGRLGPFCVTCGRYTFNFGLPDQFHFCVHEMIEDSEDQFGGPITYGSLTASQFAVRAAALAGGAVGVVYLVLLARDFAGNPKPSS